MMVEVLKKIYQGHSRSGKAVDISPWTLMGEEKRCFLQSSSLQIYRSGQGASGSKLRRIAITTSRILVFDRTRLSRSSKPRLGKD
jgi:hypothetical protein